MGKYTYDYLEKHAYWQRLKLEERPERYHVPGTVTYQMFVGDEPTETYKMVMGSYPATSANTSTDIPPTDYKEDE